MPDARGSWPAAQKFEYAGAAGGFMDIYGYEEIKNLTPNEMKEKLDPLWEEFLMKSKGGEVELSMEPAKAGKKKFMDYFFGSTPKQLAVAFIFDKDPDESEWLYAHELGRLYIDEHYSDKIKTVKVSNLNTEDETINAMNMLIFEGVKIIFTTSSRQVSASLKVAAANPDVVILNCSLNTSHKSIRTYYARFYENNRGVLVGTPTAGNAKIASKFPLKNGAVLELMNKTIKTGTGKTIDGRGVFPIVCLSNIRSSQQQNAFFLNVVNDNFGARDFNREPDVSIDAIRRGCPTITSGADEDALATAVSAKILTDRAVYNKLLTE